MMAAKTKLSKFSKLSKKNHAEEHRALPLAAPALPAEGYARLPAVLGCIGVRKSTLWTMIREKKFPAPVHLSARTVGWKVESVRGWIAERSAANESKAA